MNEGEHRLKDKVGELENYMDGLEEIVPDRLENYLKDNKARLACERLFELITESIIDLVFIFIKDNKITMPEDDEGAFNKLIELEVLPEELGKKLQDARRMRNTIAHKYGGINNELVFNAIKEELPKDILDFIRYLKGDLEID